MKLTKEQIQLGAEYLAMSNMCMLELVTGRGRGKQEIKDLPTLKSVVAQAIDAAVGAGIEGYSMEAGKGYDDRFETRAIRDVEREIKSFRADLNAGGKRAEFWIKTLTKEVPFLFQETNNESAA